MNTVDTRCNKQPSEIHWEMANEGSKVFCSMLMRIAALELEVLNLPKLSSGQQEGLAVSSLPWTSGEQTGLFKDLLVSMP